MLTEGEKSKPPSLHRTQGGSNLAGTLSFVAGKGSYQANRGFPTPGPAIQSDLGYPSGLAVGPTGNLYIGDSYNHVIEEVSGAGGPVVVSSPPLASGPSFVSPTLSDGTLLTTGDAFTVTAQDPGQVVTLSYAQQGPADQVSCSASPATSPQAGGPATIQCSVTSVGTSQYGIVFSASDANGGNTIGYSVGQEVQWISPTPDDGGYANTDDVGGFGVAAEGVAGFVPTISPVYVPPGVTCTSTSSTDPLLGNPTTSMWCTTGTMSSVEDVSFSATAGSGTLITRDFQIGPGRYVALGDSYSSGQGTGNEGGYIAGPEPEVINTNGEGGGGDDCDRSPSDAYSELLDQDLPQELPSQFNQHWAGDSGGEWTAGSNFVACNGEPAVLGGGFARSYNNEPPQLDALCTPNTGGGNATPNDKCSSPDQSVALVTLTDGGNDEDFADILTDCTLYAANTCSQVLHDAFNGTPVPGTGPWAPGGSTVGVQNLITQLASLYRQIHKDAPNARILVLGYPRLLENANTANNIYNSCYSNAFGYYMTTEKSQLIDEVEQYMNEAIALAVHESGVAEYVPLWEPSPSTGAEANITPLQTILPDENLSSFYDAMLSNPSDPNSVDHAACSQDPWINDATLNGLANNGDQESYHANPSGQQAMANAVIDYLGENPVSSISDPQILEGQTIATPVTVPTGSAALSVSIDFPEGTLSSQLVSPSGTVINSSTSASDVEYQNDPTWESYTVSDPAAGTWEVLSTGTEVVAGGEDFSVNAGAVPAFALPPTAVATATPASGAVPLTVSFSAAGSGAANGAIASYSWDFGDGTTGSASTVTHTYTADGVYSPWLTVTDGTGAVDSAATPQIVVGPLGSVSAATPFSAVPVGEQTPVQTLTVTSVGSAPLSISGLTASSDGLGDPGGAADVQIVADQCSGTTSGAGSLLHLRRSDGAPGVG